MILKYQMYIFLNFVKYTYIFIFHLVNMCEPAIGLLLIGSKNRHKTFYKRFHQPQSFNFYNS